MKTALITLALAAAASTAQALSEAEFERQYCASVSRSAHTVMKARQSGMSMAQLLEIAAESQTPEVGANLRRMVIKAFEGSRYSTEMMQTRVAEEFRDEQHLACIKGLR